ncbi:MAG: porphobilinogen synthase [Bdellovibrionales bacterium]|nr:porphobilinogen synthase [Bdellovibrionales bacterium]
MDSKLGLTLRRNRGNPWVRELTREVRVSVEQLIQPLFVVEGIPARESIPGLTGVFRETPETLLQQIEKDLEVGVTKFLLFGVPKNKGLSNFDPSFVASQIQAAKKRFGKKIFLAVDVCLCSSTAHGQCGVLSDSGDHVMNPETVSELVKAAVAYARAGADCVAPSDMMDGRIGAIRRALDEESAKHPSLKQTLILSYSAKFHSKFYGPFRVAADSAPKTIAGMSEPLKDRATYQIDPGRPSDAYLSSVRDQEEGADILMVKPGMPYLDVLADLSKRIPLPWAVYEVSGEYAAIELMAEKGLIQRNAAHLEAWTAFIRAGAEIIITYGAREARKIIQENQQS